MSDSLPDLLPSDAERALSESLESLLTDRGGVDKALARTESGQTYDDGLWHAIAAELGCAGLLIPEADGGAGASYTEAATAAEALAAFVAAVPFLGSAVVATAALLSAGSGDAAERAVADLLVRMAGGEVTTALAVPFGNQQPGTAQIRGDGMPQPVVVGLTRLGAS